MRPSVIVGFFVRFLIVYGILMVSWPGLRDAYGTFFRMGGDLLFGSSGSTGLARFRSLPEMDGIRDTEMLVKKRGWRERAPFRISSWYVGYLPTAALMGLIVATPIPWSRRSRALLWGLLLVHGFIALRLALAVAYVWSFRMPDPLVNLDLFWRKALHVGIKSISVGQTVSYIAPIVIWAFVSLRREDLAMIIPGQRHRKTKPPPRRRQRMRPTHPDS